MTNEQRDDVVEVSFADPAALEAAEIRDAALALLTGDERVKVERLRFQRDRDLHLAARALLRRSLSRRQPVAPGAWRFAAARGGKPAISAPASRLSFSVSHTRGLAMVAVAAGFDLGVDVELVPQRVPEDVVERCFVDVERDAVACAAARGPFRFAEIWTLKEGYSKARGLGLALPFESFAVDAERPRLIRADDGEESRWQLLSLSPTATHRAAVCVRSERRAHVTVRWDDLSPELGS
jgi:4'-phosphopantetheinyl transferase